MDAVSNKGEHSFSADNKVRDAEVSSGGNKEGDRHPMNTAQTVADVAHVNSVWNSRAVGPAEFVDGKKYD